MDDAGRVNTAAPPVTVLLPLPASLAAYSNVAVAAVAHPTLPLLYVFQDITGANLPPLENPAVNPVFNDLDRLLVYQVVTGAVQLVTAVRGDWFRYGLEAPAYPVTMAIDPNTHRLYLPGLREPTKPDPAGRAIGYLDLDAAGLPVVRDGKVAPAGLLEVGQGAPIQGHGWVMLSTNRVACGAHGSIIFWDQSDRVGRCQFFAPLPYHPEVIAAHPNGQKLYAIYIQQQISATELAAGRPTLQPRYLNVGGVSVPVVMASRQRIAVGQAGHVALLHLDVEGQMTGEYNLIEVTGFAGTALCYSPRFDRLYVVVKEQP